MSRSGYYKWLKPVSISGGDPRPTRREKASNTQQIKDLFSLHRRRYGTRRLVGEMKDRGIDVSRDFVRKVLADNQLRPIQPRSFVPRTTDSRHTLGYSPNLLLDRPRPTDPNQVWVSDITARAAPIYSPGERQVAVSGRMGGRHGPPRYGHGGW
ncbi:MAG: IS3 family transposase [Spirosoma sp.]|nr:IS3 family transposase [Spirosoma sp.]